MSGQTEKTNKPRRQGRPRSKFKITGEVIFDEPNPNDPRERMMLAERARLFEQVLGEVIKHQVERSRASGATPPTTRGFSE